MISLDLLIRLQNILARIVWCFSEKLKHLISTSFLVEVEYSMSDLFLEFYVSLKRMYNKIDKYKAKLPSREWES